MHVAETALDLALNGNKWKEHEAKILNELISHLYKHRMQIQDNDAIAKAAVMIKNYLTLNCGKKYTWQQLMTIFHEVSWQILDMALSNLVYSEEIEYEEHTSNTYYWHNYFVP